MQDCIVRERTRIKKDAKVRSLVCTFLVLGALGAFGSLIFLFRDYISSNVEKEFGEYLFRPVLGIFLAAAIFIIDILAHSIISTASIFEFRYAPLYILALGLGAGLLSESAYNAVRNRVDSALARCSEEDAENDAAVPKKDPKAILL